MKQKLNQILLIDDSTSDNFIHTRRIKSVDVAHKIVVKKNGLEAINYLKTQFADTGYQQPELIFLDINMPVMDGWEFLEEYDKLMEEQKGRIVLAMLTTSTAPRDRARAKEFNKLSSFLEKPLTESDLIKIVKENFPEYFEEE